MLNCVPFRALAGAVSILALGAGGCASDGSSPSPAAAMRSADGTEARLRTGLDRLVQDGRIPGAMVRIVRDGEVLADVTVGYRDVESRDPLRQDTIFRLYSMSKPITSVAILILAEEGRLSLDDPASRYLPEWRDMRVYVSGGLDDMVTEPVARPITIADLLTHTAGITYHFTGNSPVHQYYRKYGVMRDTPVGRIAGDGAPARDLDQLVSRLGQAPMLHQPGAEFAYSYSTTVLGAIVERVSGQRLDRFLDQHLFAPLGMKDTGFLVADGDISRFTTLYASTDAGLAVTERPENSDYRDPRRLLDGGGAIAGTMDDYLRFARMLANGGTLDGVRILSAESVVAMLTRRVEIGDDGAGARWLGYGLALGTAQSEAEGGLPIGGGSWSGSGNTYFFIDPRRKGVAVLMTHFLGGPQVASELSDLVHGSYYQLAAEN